MKKRIIEQDTLARIILMTVYGILCWFIADLILKDMSSILAYLIFMLINLVLWTVVYGTKDIVEYFKYRKEIESDRSRNN